MTKRWQQDVTEQRPELTEVAAVDDSRDAPVNDQQQPKAALIGRRFRPLRYHPKTHDRVAVVLSVHPSLRIGCGVALTFRYEDSPTGTYSFVSQHWFLENYAPVEIAEAS